MSDNSSSLINGNVMLPMDAVSLNDGTLAVAYTTSTAEYGRNSGFVEVRLLGESSHSIWLTDKDGDYSPPSIMWDGDILWGTHTEYLDKQRCLWIHAVKDGEKLASVQLTECGKFDNPYLAAHKAMLYLAWEDYSTGESRIAVASYEPTVLCHGDPMPIQTPVTLDGDKCYKPRMVSTGDQLYLVYEQYLQGRYRLMARCLMTGADGFTEPYEIGLDAYNDQAVSLSVHEGKVIVAWENSRPLHKGYEWASPKGAKVIIPNFGHGWRVNTTMALRRINFNGQAWQLEDLVTASDAVLESQESAGMPRVHVEDDRLYVSYLYWDYGSATVCKGWQVVTKVFDGSRWLKLADTQVFQKQRVQPAVVIANGKITSFGQSAELEKQSWPAWIQENKETYQTAQALPQVPYLTPAVFESTLRQQLVKPVVAKCAHRVTATFADGKRQLLWGDLHMHSNTSPCSLGARFHCTEMEKKFRFCHDVAALDFALNTDHDSMGDQEWIRNGNAAHFHDMPGHFVAFNGYEWTCSHFDDKPNYGHYNILYKEDGPMLRTLDDRYNSVAKVAAALDPQDALAIPHHPGDNTHPVDWNAFDPVFAPLVEIFQVRGSYEADNCAMHPQLWGRGIVRKHSLQYGLNRGYDFGFTAGGEHEGVGVTGVYATEFTREGIFNALRERRTFGTTGERIVVDFRMDDVPMGGRLETSAESARATLHVMGTDVITSVRLVSNGRTLDTWEPNSLDVALDWNEPVPPVARAYYYVVVEQCNGEMAWSSPVFVYSTKS